jgi:hypothetical protein
MGMVKNQKLKLSAAALLLPVSPPADGLSRVGRQIL